MSEAHDQHSDAEDPGLVAEEQSVVERARGSVASGTQKARRARHVSTAVPFWAIDRTRRVAASVLAGGFANRLFVWLLPFSLIVGGALGLGDATDIEDAVASGATRGAVGFAPPAPGPGGR